MRAIFTTLLLALFAHTAFASDDATTVAQRATEQLQAEIRAHRAAFEADRAAYHERVGEILLPYLDLRLTTELVFGKHWRHATEAQRAQFQKVLTRVLIDTYADALLELGTGFDLEWNRSQTKGLIGTTAVSAMVRGNTPSPLLLFAMRLNADHWQVYDVSLGGVSLVETLRAQARSLSMS